MDIFELRKLIYSSKDSELLRFLKENLNPKNHSNSTKNLKKIDEMVEDDKRFLVARLEKIYDTASLGVLIAACITLFITLFIFMATIFLERSENKLILPMVIVIVIFIVISFIVSSGGIIKKGDAKYNLSLIKRESKN